MAWASWWLEPCTGETATAGGGWPHWQTVPPALNAPSQYGLLASHRHQHSAICVYNSAVYAYPLKLENAPRELPGFKQLSLHGDLSLRSACGLDHRNFCYPRRAVGGIAKLLYCWAPLASHQQELRVADGQAWTWI
jgi:hypothetical protein